MGQLVIRVCINTTTNTNLGSWIGWIVVTFFIMTNQETMDYGPYDYKNVYLPFGYISGQHILRFVRTI